MSYQSRHDGNTAKIIRVQCRTSSEERIPRFLWRFGADEAQPSVTLSPARLSTALSISHRDPATADAGRRRTGGRRRTPPETGNDGLYRHTKFISVWKTRRRLVLPLEDEASPHCLVLAQGDARYHLVAAIHVPVSCRTEPDHTLAASNLHISLLEIPLDIWDPTSGQYTMVEPGCSLKIRPP
ncbi:hypothetical protein BHM03_00025788 [Ensete ventricosum]|nr:hypothetical protein BHM03_00025788 [Ensete ventricosum]